MIEIKTYKDAKNYFNEIGFTLKQVQEMAGRKSSFDVKNKSLLEFARFHQAIVRHMREKRKEWLESNPDSILDIKHK